MTTVRRTKSWLLGGYGFELSDTRPISVGALSLLTDSFLRNALPILLDSQGKSALRNMKGRNAQDELLSGVSHPAHDELFRLGGLAPVPGDRESIDFEPFEVSLLSPFLRFEGSSEILHTLEQHRAGPLPSWLPLRLLGYVAPLRPTFMRIGLERFRNVLAFASLGHTPQVTDSLLVDCVGGSISVRLVSERNKRRDSSPLEEIPAFRAVAEALRAAVGLDLRAELASHPT